MDGIGTDAELRVNGQEFEVEMLREGNRCILSILEVEYMFVDLYHYLFWEMAGVLYDDEVMEMVKGEESYVKMILIWDSRIGVQQL